MLLGVHSFSPTADIIIIPCIYFMFQSHAEYHIESFDHFVNLTFTKWDQRNITVRLY